MPARQLRAARTKGLLMNRRGFLHALMGAAVLDPERALWVPGAKTISISKPKTAIGWAGPQWLKVGDVITFQHIPGMYRVTEVSTAESGFHWCAEIQ